MNPKFSSKILAHRYWVVLFLMGICFYVASGAQHIKLATDYRVFFSDDNPWLLQFDEMEQTYTKADTLLLIISPKDENVFTANALSSVIEATDRMWQLPFILRIDSLSNFQHTEVDEDDLMVEDLVTEFDLEQDDELDARLADIREVSLAEPALVKRLISERGHATAIAATANFPGIDQSKELPELMAASRAMIAELEEIYPEIEFRLSGNVSMSNAFSEASQYDLKTLYPITFGVIIIGLWVFYRRVSAMIATLVVIIGSISFAFGMIGWLGIPGTPPVLNSGVMIMTLAVADCLHVSTTYFQNLRLGETKEAAITESLRINFQPVFLTTITTIIGFLSLNFAEGPPFRDLGNVVAMGIAVAFVLSLTVLPALLYILPTTVAKKQSIESRLMSRFADWVLSRHKQLFVISGALIISLVVLIPQNELNDIWTKYFDESMEARQSMEYTRKNLTGINTLHYSLKAKEAYGIYEPEYLTHVEDFVQWLETQPEVYHVSSYTTILKKLNQNLNLDNPEFYKVPDNRELAAQYNLLYELSLPQGLDLNNQINVDKSSLRISITLRDISTNGLLELEKRITNWLSENTPSYMHGTGTSTDVIFAHISLNNIVSMLGGTSIALFVISIILVIALRSVKYGVLSLIPNIAPAAMGFGIWALLNGTVGMGLSVVIGMTLGIVVDDTVHFLSKYLRARREKGMDAQQAVRYSFETVGVALTETTILLVLGFSVLTYSSFELNAQNGMMTSITIALALVVDFLFLPGLLIAIDKVKSKRFRAAKTATVTS